VDVLVAALVRAHGFIASTTREEGQLHNNDTEQLAYAVSQHKTILTHNRTDFEALSHTYLAAGQKHYGIICAVRRRPQEIAQRLLRILNHVTADEIQNQVRYI
jgi:hypothetical protein